MKKLLLMLVLLVVITLNTNSFAFQLNDYFHLNQKVEDATANMNSICQLIERVFEINLEYETGLIISPFDETYHGVKYYTPSTVSNRFNACFDTEAKRIIAGVEYDAESGKTTGFQFDPVFIDAGNMGQNLSHRQMIRLMFDRIDYKEISNPVQMFPDWMERFSYRYENCHEVMTMDIWYEKSIDFYTITEIRWYQK